MQVPAGCAADGWLLPKDQQPGLRRPAPDTTQASSAPLTCPHHLCSCELVTAPKLIYLDEPTSGQGFWAWAGRDG